MRTARLLFGLLAAGIGSGSTAFSAELLPAESPDQYMKVCDAFGEGFFFIPGTNTCLRTGGYVRVESHYVDGDPSLGSNFNNWTSRARGNIELDAQSQTEVGLVHAYVSMDMDVGLSETTPDGIAEDPNYDGTDPNLAAAYIQLSNDWWTFTAGHTGSFFDFFGSHGYGTRVLIDDNTGEQTLFAFTAAPTSITGFSFTLSAEDPSSSGRRFNGTDDYEGQELPDGVANVRLEQSWGSAQVMGVLRHLSEDDGDGLGWAAGAGASLNLPGDWVFDAQGGYTEGALAYITTDPGGVGDLEGPTGDDTNFAWSLRGGFNGPVATNLTAWLDGSYTRAEQGTGGVLEYDFWALQIGAEWEPAAGLTLGPEFAYNHIDFDVGGADQDVWGLMWRAQRSF
jgi:hypothetical protein